MQWALHIFFRQNSVVKQPNNSLRTLDSVTHDKLLLAATNNGINHFELVSFVFKTPSTLDIAL